MSSGKEFQTVGRASNGKSPTAVGTEPIAWDGDLLTAGRTYRRWHNVGSKAYRTYIRLDQKRPVKLGMHESR